MEVQAGGDQMIYYTRIYGFTIHTKSAVPFTIQDRPHFTIHEVLLYNTRSICLVRETQVFNVITMSTTAIIDTSTCCERTAMF